MIKSRNNVITYTINRNFNSNVYISVQNGEVTVKAPWYFTANQIQSIVEEKKQWISKKIKEYQESQKEYIRNEIVKILGEDCRVKVNYKNLKKPTLIVEGKNIKICLPNKYKKTDRDEILTMLIEKLYDMIADREIERAMEKTRKILGIAPEDYKIKRMKDTIAKYSNEEKIITINPDIVKYEREIIDYIVLHEFCHLKYKTHSKKFYEIIEKNMPEYKEYEKKIDLKY